MLKKNPMALLAKVLYASGAFDLIGSLYFALLVGMEKPISNPLTHPFYALLLASFLFCFALLQFQTAHQIQRNLSNLGIIILSRVFYGILFFSYFFFSKDFPSTFLPTALVDLAWSLIYIMLVWKSKEHRLKDLFVPMIIREKE